MKFREFLEALERPALDDLFGQSRDRGKIIRRERKIEPYTFNLYRGFNPEHLQNQLLTPERSEQGMLWFTHQFISGYDPVDYAKGHGQLLLTYPLTVKKIYDLVHYEDGSTDTETPKEIQPDPTENNRIRCLYGAYCLELPKGWYWTYKTEKFIGTINNIRITPNMISQND